MSSLTLNSFPFNPLYSALERLEQATKTLKFQAIKKGEIARKLVVSTQILAQMGYTKGTQLKELVIGKGKGLLIRRTTASELKDKIVYERSYGKSKRVETMLDIRNQTKINEAFLGASSARIVITKESITITPVYGAGDCVTNGAVIAIPSLSEHRDAIVSVLETMRAHEINHADLLFDDAFEASHDFLLLKTQLRRDGFNFEKSDTGMTVYLDGHKFAIKKPLELDEPKVSQAPPAVENLQSFIGMSGGVDGHLLESEGFNCTHALEWRPVEKRDTTDKTEKNALTLAVNTSCTHLYNEDIYQADYAAIGSQTFGISHCHLSLSCPDFSTLKTKAAKERSFENLSTSRDMFIPALALIDKQRPLTISIENVPSFATSPEHEIMTSRLERMGYHVTSSILDAPSCGGYTKRKRMYYFASLFDHGLELDSPIASNMTAWEVVNKSGISQLRDVTDNKTVQDGIKCGRIRLLTPETQHSPTIFRSQSRGVKDALYILVDGRYYMPSIQNLRDLMGIPDSFDMSAINTELQTEIIGNSVDAAMHKVWTKAIKKHLAEKMLVAPVLKAANAVKRSILDYVNPVSGNQLELFA